MPFLDRSKKDTSKNGPSSTQNASISNREGSFASREAAMTVEVHLPQPVEDSTIVKELITLRSHIEAHTTSFYRKDHVAVSGAELKAHLAEYVLKDAAENANGYATALASILLEARSRTTGIRIVIARILFATIDFFGDPQQTLLSPAAVSLMAAFRSKEHADESQKVYELALARWRILASFLLPTAHTRSRLEVSDTRVRDLIDKLDSILTPFIEEQYASGKGREDREDNLAMMISRILRLGTMLFAQPTMWNLSWEIPMDVQSDKQRQDPRCGVSRQKGLVVYPAIWKTGDIDGRILSKAMLKEDAEVDSSPITISRMSMDIRQDAPQPYPHSLPKKEPPRLEKRARSDSARAEQLYEQQLYDSSQKRKDFVELEYDPYRPNGQGRLHGLPRESTDFHPSYRDITGSTQKVVLSSSAAEGSYQEPMSDETALTENDIARLEQKVVSDSIPAENLHGPQDLKKASSTRREDAESRGRIFSHPVMSRRPYVQLQQQNSPAKERIIGPEPSLSKTDIGEHSNVPVSPSLTSFDGRKSSDEDPQLEGDGPSDAYSCSGKDTSRREPKPDYDSPTSTPPYEPTIMDHPRFRAEPPKLPTKAEQDTRVQAPPQKKSSTSISGPRPQSPMNPAHAEHGSTARITSQEPNLAQEQDYRPESPERKIKRKHGIVGRTKSQGLNSRDGGGPKADSQRTEAKAQYDIVSNAQSREPTKEHDLSLRQPSPDTQYNQQHVADDASPVFRHNFSKHRGRKIGGERQRSPNFSRKSWRSWLK